MQKTAKLYIQQLGKVVQKVSTNSNNTKTSGGGGGPIKTKNN